eukprot:8825471-Prorocentrum_lima.AAC.1
MPPPACGSLIVPFGRRLRAAQRGFRSPQQGFPPDSLALRAMRGDVSANGVAPRLFGALV